MTDNPGNMPRREPGDRTSTVTTIPAPTAAAPAETFLDVDRMPAASRDVELEGYLALYDTLKARADEAAKQFEACKTAIKVKLQTAAPDVPKVTVASPHMARPLVMSARCTRTIDSKALREKEPELAEQFTRESWSWRLEAQR